MNDQFSYYIATQEDLNAIEEALEYVWRPEIEYIFKDKSQIEHTIVLSFDSQKLFIWKRIDGKYERSKINHAISFTDKDQRGWSTNFKVKEIKKLLPSKLLNTKYSFISGPLLQPYTKIQETKPTENNPHTTKESYMATIVHEFAHVYFNHSHPSYFSDARESVEFLEHSIHIIENSKSDNLEIKFLHHKSMTELFAFCSEYSACCAFWLQQKQMLDTYHVQELNDAIETEKSIDLDCEDSYLNNDHNYSVVMGRILMKSHPTNWPDILLQKRS